jgi:flagellar biosynthesis component FlhA
LRRHEAGAVDPERHKHGRPANAGDPEDGFQGKDMGFAFGIVVILSILFLPIPAFLIDVGLAFRSPFRC